MKFGLQISSFTWPGGPEQIGPTLARIVRQADDAGFDSIWVMDHFFQIRGVGRPEEPMLEGMTDARLHGRPLARAPASGLMVGGVHYRHPGLWVKAATTLDVLSGGRAWLGIGAAWNEEESRSLGFPFPPLGDRFELLEDTLRIAHGMWSGERGTEAAVRRAATSRRRACSTRPQSLSAGPGCRSWSAAAARRRRSASWPSTPTPATCSGRPRRSPTSTRSCAAHCAAVGRDPDEIERSTLQNVRPRPDGAARSRDPGPGRRPVRRALRRGRPARHLRASEDVHDPAYLELLGRDVLPALHAPVTGAPRLDDTPREYRSP